MGDEKKSKSFFRVWCTFQRIILHISLYKQNLNNIPRSLKKSKNSDGSERDKITESKNSKQGLINQIKLSRQFMIFLVHFISFVGSMHQATFDP